MTYRLTFAAWFALVLFTTSASAADELGYEITVDAGKQDRVNVPVRFAVDAAPQAGTKVTILGDDAVLGQLTGANLADGNEGGEVHFILPSLKAGEKRQLQVKINRKPKVGDVEGYHWQDASTGETDLVFGKPVLKYVHPTLDDTSPATREQTYKPFHHVYSPDGSRIVTKGPGGKYTHHRGLYFGFNRISYGPDFAEKCDVWHCKAPAYQNHEQVSAKEEGFVLGRHRLAIGWHGAKGEKFAAEEREVGVYNVAGGQFIDFASRVSTVDGPIKLDGDPQHSGFHFRADNEVADKTAKQTYFLRPDGKGGPGETRNWDAKKVDPKAVNEPWKVMSFVLGDKRYSVLRIDHPENPGEDRSSERDYGRVGGYFEYVVTKDAPLKVKYRIVLKDGEFDAAEAERLTADFVDPPKVTVKKL